jgi:hypothetical protein
MALRTRSHIQIPYAIGIFYDSHSVLTFAMPFILMRTRNIRNMTTSVIFSYFLALILQAQLYTRLVPSLFQLLRKQTPDEQLLRPFLIAKHQACPEFKRGEPDRKVPAKNLIYYPH